MLNNEQIEQIPRRYQPMKVSEWVVTFLLLYIPIVNIILLFVWAFGDGANESKKNFAKAILYIFFAIIGIVFAFYALALLLGLTILALGS